MTRAINKFDGEDKINLYGIEYPVRWNAQVYFQFKSETGIDPNGLFMEAINEINTLKSIGLFEEDPEVANSTLMFRLSAIIHADYAAWMFYLAANAMDKAVTFEEIQEGVLMEGVTQYKTGPDGDYVKTYPYLFYKFALFALGVGVDKDVKKKKGSGLSFIDLIKEYL